MEVFAHFEIIDLSTNSSIVEGHKASFCLEDNECDQDDEVLDRSRYACADFGDQGISVGCGENREFYVSNSSTYLVIFSSIQWISTNMILIASGSISLIFTLDHTY